MVIEQGAFLKYLGRDKSPVESWTSRHQQLLTDMPLGLFNAEQMGRVKNDDAIIGEGVEAGLALLGFRNSQIERGFAEPKRIFKDRSVYYQVTFSGDGSAHSSQVAFVYNPGHKEGHQYLRCDSQTFLYVTRSADPSMTIERAMRYIADPAAIHLSYVFVYHIGGFDAEKVADFVQVLAIGKQLEMLQKSPRD